MVWDFTGLLALLVWGCNWVFIMKIIEWVSNWNGGYFEPKDEVKEGLEVFVTTTEKTYIGILKKGQKVHGVDHDMGHTYSWSFQDYDISFVTDPFDRKTSLLRTLKENKVSVSTTR